MTGAPAAPLLKVKAQILLGDTIAIGPGKAALLEAIVQTGSIAAAGRTLGLSYRRTRDMIDALNTSWREPLVVTIRGGRAGGGAALSPTGALVLKHYRALETALLRTATMQGAGLLALIGKPA